MFFVNIHRLKTFADVFERQTSNIHNRFTFRLAHLVHSLLLVRLHSRIFSVFTDSDDDEESTTTLKFIIPFWTWEKINSTISLNILKQISFYFRFSSDFNMWNFFSFRISWSSSEDITSRSMYIASNCFCFLPWQIRFLLRVVNYFQLCVVSIVFPLFYNFSTIPNSVEATHSFLVLESIEKLIF